ncbi:protein-glutamate methylesterase/protein-glutamine glutaminase [Hyalangium rubrum]|uniref:Protein-glutamate methylesterase/protein-glutamine glutaminase n=1 Tax=Hyalangium rubrum TaxID=3103134 RepID=A0ABU5H931_9BACT|nr:chemotaxis response regulator protein-glutamate methylesterase [Hyalangium sp. s54d21]MDY7229811.1 chemotaxis response regulator protein-glutamate methylesterase [Hyalangium sp. s54d21]
MAPIRILVADNSAVARREISQMLGADPDLDVVATASTGRITLERVGQLHPDVLVLELAIPDLSGMDVLKALRKQAPSLPVLVFSALTESAGNLTLDALALGASDYITKPSSGGTPVLERAREQLIAKIKALHARSRQEPQPAIAPRGIPEPPKVQPRLPRVAVVAIGASTGGPNMLTEVLSEFPADFPVPVLITQHMPPVFTKLFAERLNTVCRLQVREATPGEMVRAGQIWIAPGDYHLTVVRDGPMVRLATHQGPPENSCRPAVDVLFRSAATVYGSGVLAVVMTGMGQDGLKGCQAVNQVSGQLMVQDPNTCIIGSMPRAVIQAGLSPQVVPLHDLGAEIVRRATRIPPPI